MFKYDVSIIAFVNIETDARTLNISNTFAENGYKVLVVGLGKKNAIEHHKNYPVDYYKISVNQFQKTWKRWLDFYRKATIIINDLPAKVTFAEDVYSLPIANEAAKFHKSKLIYDSREIYSQIGPLAGRKTKQKIITLMEKRYIKRVNTIIVTAEIDSLYLKEHLTNKIPYYTVKNLPPYKNKIDSDIIREKFNIPADKKIVLYQGMLLNGRGIENTIGAIANLENIVFVALGEGPLREDILKIIKKKNLKTKVILPGAIPYSELHTWTSAADIGLSLIEPVSISYEHALPNKIFEYTMARIPTLCTDLPAQKEVIDKFGIGEYISRNISTDEIAYGIENLLRNKSEYISYCEKAAQELSFQTQHPILLNLID